MNVRDGSHRAPPGLPVTDVSGTAGRRGGVQNPPCPLRQWGKEGSPWEAGRGMGPGTETAPLVSRDASPRVSRDVSPRVSRDANSRVSRDASPFVLFIWFLFIPNLTACECQKPQILRTKPQGPSESQAHTRMHAGWVSRIARWRVSVVMTGRVPGALGLLRQRCFRTRGGEHTCRPEGRSRRVSPAVITRDIAP